MHDVDHGVRACAVAWDLRTCDLIMSESCEAAAVGPKPVQHALLSGDWLHRRASDDVDVHCAGLEGWRMHYDQIGAGAFRGSFSDMVLPGMQVFREVTNRKVHQHGRMGRGCFGFAVPWQCSGEINVNGASVPPDVALASFDADVDMCTPDDFELRGVVMDATLIEDALQSMETELVSGVWHRLRAMRLPPEQARRIHSLLSFALEAADSTPWVFDDAGARKHLADSLLMEVVEALPRVQPCDDFMSGAARKRTVDRACHLMLAQQESALSILDVCKSVGASRRKLNYCFLEVVGTSPIRYLRAIRLNGVRRDLKRGAQSGEGVHDIAIRWGFWHFSQFSLDYKRQFAELPSETLRRAREACA